MPGAYRGSRNPSALRSAVPLGRPDGPYISDGYHLADASGAFDSRCAYVRRRPVPKGSAAVLRGASCNLRRLYLYPRDDAAGAGIFPVYGRCLSHRASDPKGTVPYAGGVSRGRLFPWRIGDYSAVLRHVPVPSLHRAGDPGGIPGPDCTRGGASERLSFSYCGDHPGKACRMEERGAAGGNIFQRNGHPDAAGAADSDRPDEPVAGL